MTGWVRQVSGKRFNRSAEQTAGRIVARVVAVLPNGDLRIEADKLVKINKEDEQLKTLRHCAPTNVSPENAVATNRRRRIACRREWQGISISRQRARLALPLFDKISRLMLVNRNR